MSGFMQANIDFLYQLAGMRSDFLTAVIKVITMFGEELIPIILLCAVYWCYDKKLAYGVGIAFFATGTVVQGMKIGFRIPRPWDLDSAFSAVASEQAKLYGSYSFPSGHTQTAAALFGTLGFAVKNTVLKVVCFLLVLLVGFSRMYLGVHTPLDVVVSLILTLAVAAICAKTLCKAETTKSDLMILVIILALGFALLIFAMILNGTGKITDDYTLDSVKQAVSAFGFAIGVFVERRWIKFDIKTRTIWGQILKYVLGIAGVLVIKEGLKLVIGSGMVPDAFRYFLLLFWIAALYPLIVKAVLKKKKA